MIEIINLYIGYTKLQMYDFLSNQLMQSDSKVK